MIKLKRRESETQAVILKWLNLQENTFAFRVHSMGIPIGRTGTFRRNPHKGISDILGVKNSKAFAFEVKAEGKKATDEQRFWMQMFAEAGGYACIVHSLEDAEEAFNEV